MIHRSDSACRSQPIRPSERLALGTVQFGLPYGVTNDSGQVSVDEIRQILSSAATKGVLTLDTAALYGGSEERLGEVGTEKFSIVTKLPDLPEGLPNTEVWVREQLAVSLSRLKLDRVAGLLLHRPGTLMGAEGPALWSALKAVKAEGLVGSIGYSVYEPGELSECYGRYRADLVQLPYNILDRRFETSGWLDRLSSNGTIVHSRSAFLQGLLLLPRDALPTKFSRWQARFDAWHDWCAANRLTPLQAALGHCVSTASINRVLVGVVTANQLEEIVLALPTQDIEAPESLSVSDLDLINPSRWSAL